MWRVIINDCYAVWTVRARARSAESFLSQSCLIMLLDLMVLLLLSAAVSRERRSMGLDRGDMAM